MSMKGNQTNRVKRVVKSYKVPQAVYASAKKKAKKEKTTVANRVEYFLYDYVSR